MEPKWTETDTKWTEIKLSGLGWPGGFVGMGGRWGVGCKGKRESLPFCDSYIARFFPLGNPGELDSVGEFTKIEGRKQSSAWCGVLIRA